VPGSISLLAAIAKARRTIDSPLHSAGLVSCRAALEPGGLGSVEQPHSRGLLRGESPGAELLGRPHRVRGVVVGGRHAPRQDARLSDGQSGAGETLAPGNGVYAVARLMGDSAMRAPPTVGANPTFGEQARKIEVHLIDFTGDLYGNSCRRFRRSTARDASVCRPPGIGSSNCARMSRPCEGFLASPSVLPHRKTDVDVRPLCRFTAAAASDNPPNRFESIHYERDPDLPPEEEVAPATVLYRDTTRTIIATNDSPDVVSTPASTSIAAANMPAFIVCAAVSRISRLLRGPGLRDENPMVKEDARSCWQRTDVAEVGPATHRDERRDGCLSTVERKLRLTGAAWKCWPSFAIRWHYHQKHW